MITFKHLNLAGQDHQLCIYIYIAKKLHRSIWLNLSIYIIYNIYIYIYIAYAWSDKPLSIQAPHAWAVSCKRVNIYCCHCFRETIVAQVSLNATMITQWSNNRKYIHDLPVLAHCEPGIPKPTDGLESGESHFNSLLPTNVTFHYSVRCHWRRIQKYIGT